MNAWWFRTKPRSILKTLKWFPYFANLEGKDWNERLDHQVSAWGNKPIYPIRREYIYKAHYDEFADRYSTYEEYLSGRYDINETESAGRNDKTTFEFYGLGYVDKQGIIKVTESGHIVKEGRMDENLLLKLLLKIQFPSPAINKKYEGIYVFPLEIILNVYKHFNSLNRFELGFLFMCNEISKLDITIKSINEFRDRYEKLENKLDVSKVVKIFKDIMRVNFTEVNNKPETYYRDYSDALIRALEYTGLFSQRGRGYYVKLYIPDHAKLKVKLLQEQYNFVFNKEENLEKYMEWFGNPYNVLLPWENEDNLKYIIDNKINIFEERLREAEKSIVNFNANEKSYKIKELIKYRLNEDKKTLLETDILLSRQIKALNEELFIKYYSKTKDVREEIIERFIDILEGNEDMAALWLECNTWKSLIAINGDHCVKRNFKIEDDLSPRAFAPGMGNTPDMELYKNGYILIPEVSLMTGVRQWEHEGSSVIDHVFKFIEKYDDKQVLGIFISSSMNVRTIWQFYILNRESWIGKPVPVVPITIRQYIEIIKNVYQNNLDINDFKELLYCIHKATFRYGTFKEWQENIDVIIGNWINKMVS